MSRLGSFVAHPVEEMRWRLDTRRQGQWRTEIAKVTLGRAQAALADELLPTSGGDGRQAGDWPTSIGDLDGLAALHALQIPTGVLTQLPDPDAFHVLHRSI